MPRPILKSQLSIAGSLDLWLSQKDAPTKNIIIFPLRSHRFPSFKTGLMYKARADPEGGVPLGPPTLTGRTAPHGTV